MIYLNRFSLQKRTIGHIKNIPIFLLQTSKDVESFKRDNVGFELIFGDFHGLCRKTWENEE